MSFKADTKPHRTVSGAKSKYFVKYGDQYSAVFGRE